MSWNYKELDQRAEIAALKEQLSVQAARCAQFEGKIFNYENDLEETKVLLLEVTNKFRHEEAQVTRLEADLKRRTEDYNREKFDRENKENSLRNLGEEIKRQATANKESQLVIERLSCDNNGSLAEHLKVVQEKAKLEVQVRELQGELRIRSRSPPPSSKVFRRPRSSSLTNLKVASLENDLAQAASSSSECRAELDRTKEKLRRAQDNVVRMENEKCALEKKVVEKERLLGDMADEVAQRDEELAFFRKEAGSGEREAELIARIEEEEVRCRLLEQQLAKSSGATVPRHAFDELQERVIDLTTEKEMAQDELHDATIKLRQFDEELREANAKLKAAEKGSWALRDQVYALQSKSAFQMDDETVNQLNATITRLRAERDSAQRSLEFMQMESRFTIDALEGRIVSSEDSIPTRRDHSEVIKRANLTMRGLVVVMQHTSSQNDTLVAQLDKLLSDSERHVREVADLVSAREEQEKSALNNSNSANELQANLDEVSLLLTSSREECDGLRGLISNLEGNVEALTTDVTQLRRELGVKQNEVSDLKTYLATTSEELERVQAERESHEHQIRTLEENLESVQRDLLDAEQRSNHLQATQFTTASPDDKMRALKDEIKVLESRILRRTEQIGIHQHDIKRLETNMRLAEERLGELSSELEMANTEKEAMVEDCAVAREERDEAKRLAADLELAVDDLTRQVADKDIEMASLRQSAVDLHSTITNVEDTRLAEASSLISVIFDHQSRLRQVSSQVTRRDAEARELERKLEEAENRFHALNTSRANDVARLTEELRTREVEIASLRETLNRNEADLQTLGEECEALRLSHGSLQSVVQEAGASTERVRELEADCERLQEQNARLRSDVDGRDADIASLKESIDRAARIQGKTVASLTEESAKLKDHVSLQAIEHESVVRDLKKESAQLKALLEATRREIDDLRTSYDTDLSSQRELAAKEASELQCRVEALLKELDNLHGISESERKATAADKQDLLDKIAALSQERDNVVKSEETLREQSHSYRLQLNEATANLERALSEKIELKSELDDLAGETQRAISQSDSLQKQAMLSERHMSSVQDEMNQLREQLSQSEKAGKTAEMNLLLMDTEHKRTITTLRQRLSALEEGGAQVAELQRANMDLREQVTEMESLLREKCAEIEGNDDKFIEVLKEKKKLSSKVETLTRKVTSLQSKLERASTTPSPPSVVPPPKTYAQPSVTTEVSSASRPLVQPRQPLAPLPPDALSISQANTRITHAPGFKTLPPPPLERISGQFQPAPERVFKENRTQPTRIVPSSSENAMSVPPSTGKRRRAPDDDGVPSLPATAVVADCDTPPGASFFEPMSSSQAGTPRFKRHIQALKTGFTPTRLQGLRPTLSQPSPIRKAASKATPTMQDVTNSPRRATSAQVRPRGGASWLTKIQNKTGNALNLGRTSRQASTEDLFDSDNFS